MTKSGSRMIRAGVIAGLIWGIGSAVSGAETLPLPVDDPVLKVFVSSAVKTSEDAAPPQEKASFDLAMLRQMPVTTFRTSTVWTEGISEFTGVSLKDFVQALDVTSGTLLMYAVNDYVAEVPVSDAIEGGPILAYLMDGQEMSVRDKGPLWVIYPYDANPDYQTEVVYSRSIWQLVKIEIKP